MYVKKFVEHGNKLKKWKHQGDSNGVGSLFYGLSIF